MTDDDATPAGVDPGLRRRIVRSSAWVGLGFGGGQILAFASTLVLVRLLDPESFGVVAAATTLLAIVTRIQESGLGAALVHDRGRDPRDTAATTLVFSTAAGLALTLAVVAAAPLYARLIRLPDAAAYLQALAPLLALRGIAVAPTALLERALDFRASTKAELAGYATQATVAIGCAIGGLGAWSLVAGQLAGALATTALMWALVPFVPSPRDASRTTLREMLRYGRHVSGANVMVVVNNSIDNISVGRFLGAGPLGVYALAWRLAELPNTVISVIVGRVMFSVYSRLQHDLAAVRDAYVENMQRTMLLALPVTVTLGIAAEPVVLGLLGHEWEGAVRPLQLLSVFGLLRLLGGPSGEVFKGVGRPQLGLLSTLLFFAVAAPALVILVPRYGTTGAAGAMVVAAATAGTVALVLTCRILSLPARTFVAALARPFACAGVVALAVFSTVVATEAARPIVALAAVAIVAATVTIGSFAVLARPLVAPVLAALRRV